MGPRQSDLWWVWRKIMVKVTDLDYYMDGFLKTNLDEVPRFLKQGWDCVIIVSGHSKVRIGKTTLASQIGYYLAWLQAGGPNLRHKPKFSNENICFMPEELMKKAETFPRNSVFIYDEAMTGLNSSRAMENINKTMLDFFTECGNLGHIIIIVLPNFFRLQEDIAVPRSLFLVDVYTDQKYQRGRFAFYNELQKELLYGIGKKLFGTYKKYNSINPFFRGKFVDLMPNIDKEQYETQKMEARKKKRMTRYEKKIMKQRNACFYIMRNKNKMTEQQIADDISVISKAKLTRQAVNEAIFNILGREG
jgi:hypothetical protein